MTAAPLARSGRPPPPTTGASFPRRAGNRPQGRAGAGRMLAGPVSGAVTRQEPLGAIGVAIGEGPRRWLEATRDDSGVPSRETGVAVARGGHIMTVQAGDG